MRILERRARPQLFYLMVNDAAVSLEDRGVRLGQPDGGCGGPPQLLLLLLLLLMLTRARVVGVPGCAAEAAVVDEEEAGAQQEHEKHRYPMALAQRHKAHGDTRARSVGRQTHSARPHVKKTKQNFLQLVHGARRKTWRNNQL